MTPPAGTMAQGWALLLLLLLPRQLGVVLATRTPGFGRSGARSLSPEENEFSEEEPVLVLSPEEPGRGPATIDCPRDCACSQEGVVDCGGIDLREFPGDLPEHTNHLSLQVRLRRCANGHGRRRLPRTWWLPSRNRPHPYHSPCPWPPTLQTQGARAGQTEGWLHQGHPGSDIPCTEHCDVMTCFVSWEESGLRLSVESGPV